jgi:hypothetical protein
VWGGSSATGGANDGQASSPVARLARPPGLGSPRVPVPSVVRSPRELPHELESQLEVIEAARGSWEPRSHAGERLGAIRLG